MALTSRMRLKKKGQIHPPHFLHMHSTGLPGAAAVPLTPQYNLASSSRGVNFSKVVGQLMKLSKIQAINMYRKFWKKTQVTFNSGTSG